MLERREVLVRELHDRHTHINNLGLVATRLAREHNPRHRSLHEIRIRPRLREARERAQREGEKASEERRDDRSRDELS